MIYIQMTLNENITASNAAVLERDHYYNCVVFSHTLHKVLPTLSEKQCFPVDITLNTMALLRFYDTFEMHKLMKIFFILS